MTQPNNIIPANAGVSRSAQILKTAATALLDLWRFGEAAYEQINARREIEHMLSLEDNVLRDMGVSRADIRRAVNLPLRQSAGDELARISQNARNY